MSLFVALHDRPPFLSRPSLTGHCGHGWTSSLPRPVASDPGCVKTLRGITAPGILGSTVTRRAKKRKNLSSARHYDQIRFRFHTAKTLTVDVRQGFGAEQTSATRVSRKNDLSQRVRA